LIHGNDSVPQASTFDPELIDSMSTAYASVCQALDLGTKSDQATATVAPKIIEIATRGARSPSAIHLLAMDELRESKIDRHKVPAGSQLVSSGRKVEAQARARLGPKAA
jgi:hypothetical protein